MKRRLFIAVLAVIAAVSLLGAERRVQAARQPVIQLAILLDTSGSMSGLIDQARTQLWKIVNEFIVVQQDGVKPELQVALYEYGKSSLSRERGYIRQILPLTTDLDRVSQELFALATNGGDEYCGQVIRDAVADLKWSAASGDFRAIFIAGNEPFTQGTADYRLSVKAAVDRGIVVNTIHCGGEAEGVNGHWKDGAVLADGSFMCIDHNAAALAIAAPQDKRIAELGAALNATYIAFGQRGGVGAANQMAQDGNAAGSSLNALVNRSVFKSAAQYRNSDWDLVDALEAGSVKLTGIRSSDLPENMRAMTTAEQEAYVDAKRAERRQLAAEIAQLNDARQSYLAEKLKEAAGSATETLDTAMSKAIQAMLAKKQFVSK